MQFLQRIRDAFSAKMFNFVSSQFAFVGRDTYAFKPEYLYNLNFEMLQNKAMEVLWRSAQASAALRQINVLAMSTGLRLQSTPIPEILGVTSEEAAEMSRKNEAVFSLVRKQKSCSYEGNKTFNELEILGFWSWLIFNETFAVVRYSKDLNSVCPVNIQIVNPLLVRTPGDQTEKEPAAEIIDGIELLHGVPVAFWVKDNSNVGAGFVRVPLKDKAGNVHGLHVFKAEVPNQIRGISRLAKLFHEFQRMLEAYDKEMDSMVLNASIAMVIERNKTVINKEKFQNAVKHGGDLSSAFAALDNGAIPSDDRTIKSGGIVVQTGEEGEVFKTLDTARPNVNINEFILGLMKAVGPAIGIPVELWLALFGKAYSASKGSIDLGYRGFEQELFEFSSGFEQPIYEIVISAYVANGFLKVKEWNSLIKRAAYLVTEWFGAPKPSLNPFQEEKAATERVNNWRSTYEREAQLGGGISFDTIAARRKSEVKQVHDIEDMYENSGITAEDLAA